MRSTTTTTSLHVRKADRFDIDALYELIQAYANQGIMLPRSKQTLFEHLDSFVVAEIDQQLVGCGSLSQLAPDLVEIRSLGISQSYKGQGIGSQLISFLLNEARKLGIRKVMALTYEVAFFQKNGFEIVPKHIFQEKVWKDCVTCKKQYCCDEIAVLKRLD